MTKLIKEQQNNEVFIRLLKSKTRCLERLLAESESFSRLAKSGDFATLSEFQTKRASILKASSLYDRKLNEIATSLLPHEKTADLKDLANQQLNAQHAIIHSLIAIDSIIIQAIEEEKTRLSKDLQESSRKSQNVGKFKSKWMAESGDKLDGTL